MTEPQVRRALVTFEYRARRRVHAHTYTHTMRTVRAADDSGPLFSVRWGKWTKAWQAIGTRHDYCAAVLYMFIDLEDFYLCACSVCRHETRHASMHTRSASINGLLLVAARRGASVFIHRPRATCSSSVSNHFSTVLDDPWLTRFYLLESIRAIGRRIHFYRSYLSEIDCAFAFGT